LCAEGEEKEKEEKEEEEEELKPKTFVLRWSLALK